METASFCSRGGGWDPAGRHHLYLQPPVPLHTLQPAQPVRPDGSLRLAQVGAVRWLPGALGRGRGRLHRDPEGACRDTCPPCDTLTLQDGLVARADPPPPRPWPIGLLAPRSASLLHHQARRRATRGSGAALSPCSAQGPREGSGDAALCDLPLKLRRPRPIRRPLDGGCVEQLGAALVLRAR